MQDFKMAFSEEEMKSVYDRHRKRSLSIHQKQMRFFAVSFIAIALVLFTGLIYLISH